MIVDVNLHWYPENFYSDKSFLNSALRMIPRAYGEHVEVYDLPEAGKKQIKLARPKGCANLEFEPIATDTADRLKAMDKTGIDKGILRWPIWPEWLNLELCQKANDAMAKSVKEHPNRFLGLAIVPPWGDEDCLKELERCIKDLGFCGVQVAAHYGTLYLDAEEFRPHFRKIGELNVPVVVHHTPLPADYGHICDYTNLRRLFGRCIDQMTSVGRILYSGILDELPNLKFVHSMMAGGLFAYADLITPKKSTVSGDRERFEPAASDKVRGYLKHNIYCDITHAPPWGKAQLECAVKVLGAENVLFGSSYPLRSEWLYQGVEYVQSLDIGEEEKSLILGGNAVRIFKIEE